VEELLRAEVADLQGELRQAKAIHDATVSETNKLMRDCSALKASYMQLAGEAKLKEDMVGLLQQQLEELSQQLPDMAQEIAGDTPELQGLGVTASEGTEVAALRKPRITDASRSLSMPVQKVPLAQDP
jgi:chromosome segregation ATPase